VAKKMAQRRKWQKVRKERERLREQHYGRSEELLKVAYEEYRELF